MQIQRLSAPLGAIVDGLDVREINEETLQKLRDLFNEFKVLVFPGQDLNPEDQMKFVEISGLRENLSRALIMEDFEKARELKAEISRLENSSGLD